MERKAPISTQKMENVFGDGVVTSLAGGSADTYISFGDDRCHTRWYGARRTSDVDEGGDGTSLFPALS